MKMAWHQPGVMKINESKRKARNANISSESYQRDGNQ